MSCSYNTDNNNTLDNYINELMNLNNCLCAIFSKKIFLKNILYNPSISQNIENKFNEIINMTDNHEKLNLLFRYIFYIRSVKYNNNKPMCFNKYSKTIFYYLFDKLYKFYPDICLNMMDLIPEYGYFGDLDNIIKNSNYDNNILNKCNNIYYNYLNKDCLTIFGKSIREIEIDEAKNMNSKLKLLTIDELKDFMLNKSISMASKWVKREGKNNSKHRKDLILSIYYPNGDYHDLEKSKDEFIKETLRKRLSYKQMVFRNIISTLSQCLYVGEQMMCETNDNYRKWDSIPFENTPSKFNKKYKNAFEKYDDLYCDKYKDRIVCNQHFNYAKFKKRLYNSNDLNNVFTIIYNSITKSVSDTEKNIISTFWDNIVSKYKNEINSCNIIPVIDMYNISKLQNNSIGLGVLFSNLCSNNIITFSDNPNIIELEQNIINNYQTILKLNVKDTCNINKTYQLLLNYMIDNNIKETDFTLLYLSYRNFNSVFDNDIKSNLDKIELEFKEHNCNFPKLVFWDLSYTSLGKYVEYSDNIQLINGFLSNNLLKKVLDNDYTNKKTNKKYYSSKEIFLNNILDSQYNYVENVLKCV
jgi:hypothetical protein